MFMVWPKLFTGKMQRNVFASIFFIEDKSTFVQTLTCYSLAGLSQIPDAISGYIYLISTDVVSKDNVKILRSIPSMVIQYGFR